MEGVVRQVVLVDVAPQVLLRPVRERVDLPDVALLVALELGGLCPGGCLLAPDPGDPRLDAGQCALERIDLGLAAAAVDRPRLSRAACVEHLDLDPEAVLELLPGREGLG